MKNAPITKTDMLNQKQIDLLSKTYDHFNKKHNAKIAEKICDKIFPLPDELLNFESCVSLGDKLIMIWDHLKK
jgi:hypothetical protein